MARSIDMIKQKFGRLTVLERSKRNTKSGDAIWLCECSCGQMAEVIGYHLRKGRTKSCGCLQRETSAKRLREKPIRWLGDKVGYSAAHDWLRQNKPKPDLCERCRECPAQELSYIFRQGFSRNIEDYLWLCHACHMHKDLGDPNSKPMTKVRIHRIREFHKTGAVTKKSLAGMFKVHPATIGRIINCKNAYATI